MINASAAVQLASMATLPSGLALYQSVAPPLMWSEALSAIGASAFRGDVPNDTVDALLERFEGLEIEMAEVDADHRGRALRLARSLGWAKSYDAEYLVLAQKLACPLLTMDARLIRGAGHLIEMIAPSALSAPTRP